MGEPMIDQRMTATHRPLSVDTYGGRIYVEWDPQAAVTPLGQLPFFIEFLKTADLFAPWVQDCPVTYTSPNAPEPVDLLGTLLLSVLSGHQRYAHITTIRNDGVNPALLGMRKVCSEDSVRRALKTLDAQASRTWLQTHLRRCYDPLLYEDWILDLDVTVKPLYGHQVGAEIGYNPHKPGRPSHTYHTYVIGNLRLVLDVEVQSGKHHAAAHTRPGLWQWLEHLPRAAWPAFLRGDWAFCRTDGLMREAEQRGLPYPFKLKQTSKVRGLLQKLFAADGVEVCGQGWEGVDTTLLLPRLGAAPPSGRATAAAQGAAPAHRTDAPHGSTTLQLCGIAGAAPVVRIRRLGDNLTR